MAEQSLEEYRRQLAAEWGTYVASEAIDIHGARAFNVGDPVPLSHVENGVVGENQVVKTATKAGQKVVADTTPEKG